MRTRFPLRDKDRVYKTMDINDRKKRKRNINHPPTDLDCGQNVAIKSKISEESVVNNHYNSRSFEYESFTKIMKNIDIAIQAVETTEIELKSNSQKAKTIIDSLRQIVWKIPFVSMLQSMKPNGLLDDVPIISKQYEENFMRSCSSNQEKPCISGRECECMFINPNKPFVCIQFVLPQSTITSSGLCIICLRKTTQLLFHKTIFNGLDPKTCIQKHGNICGEIGEYHASAMLICNPNGPVHCMPLPIVAHQRNRYSVCERAGVKFLKQLNVAESDFV